MSNLNDLPSLSQICAVRAARIKSELDNFNTLTRDEIISPYLNAEFSPSDLDMRRKAEILKYRPAHQSNQTNNLTNRQQFAQNANRTFNVSNISESDITSVTSRAIILSSTCALGDNSSVVSKSRPSSSSNVPGTKMLYYDPNVPLYMFKKRD